MAEKNKTSEIACLARKEKRLLAEDAEEFVYLYLFGIGLAFGGWIMENCYKFVTQGVIDCRFHLLPFLSPYALIPFLFRFLIRDPDRIAVFGRRVFRKDCKKNKILSNLLCFLILSLSFFFGELAVGNLWEILFRVQLWNYGLFRIRLTQYAALVPTLGHGCASFLLFRFLYPPTLNLIRKKIPFRTAKRICLTLGVSIVLDTLLTMAHIAVFGKAPMYWTVRLRG